MLIQSQVQKLMDDGWLKIDPFFNANLVNGVLSITFQNIGQVLNPIDYNTYLDDPREIVINIYKASLPLANVDVSTYKLSPGLNIVVKSNEKITLNDQVFAIVYPSYQTSVPLEIHTSNILYPGFNDNLVIRVTNPWPYPVYLDYNKEIVKVVFYSMHHSYHTGLTEIDHPASAIAFDKTHADAPFDNTVEVQTALNIIIQRIINLESGLIDLNNRVSSLDDRVTTLEDKEQGESGYSGYSGLSGGG